MSACDPAPSSHAPASLQALAPAAVVTPIDLDQPSRFSVMPNDCRRSRIDRPQSRKMRDGDVIKPDHWAEFWHILCPASLTTSQKHAGNGHPIQVTNAD